MVCFPTPFKQDTAGKNIIEKDNISMGSITSGQSPKTLDDEFLLF